MVLCKGMLSYPRTHFKSCRHHSWGHNELKVTLVFNAQDQHPSSCNARLTCPFIAKVDISTSDISMSLLWLGISSASQEYWPTSRNVLTHKQEECQTKTQSLTKNYPESLTTKDYPAGYSVDYHIHTQHSYIPYTYICIYLINV